MDPLPPPAQPLPPWLVRAVQVAVLLAVGCVLAPVAALGVGLAWKAFRWAAGL